MSKTTMFNLPDNFNMQKLVHELLHLYRTQGFQAIAYDLGAGVTIDLKKDDDGARKYIGLAQGIKVNLMVQNETLIASFTDEEWTGKIVAFAIGWATCFILYIPAIIGSLRQIELSDKINTDIRMLTGAYSGYTGGHNTYNYQ